MPRVRSLRAPGEPMKDRTSLLLKQAGNRLVAMEVECLFYKEESVGAIFDICLRFVETPCLRLGLNGDGTILVRKGEPGPNQAPPDFEVVVCEMSQLSGQIVRRIAYLGERIVLEFDSDTITVINDCDEFGLRINDENLARGLCKR